MNKGFREQKEVTMPSNELILKVKKMIVETLNLEDLEPEDIDTDAPLFGDGLGLDSIDALELGLGLKSVFGITISQDDPNIKQYFASVAELASFIEANGKVN